MPVTMLNLNVADNEKRSMLGLGRRDDVAGCARLPAYWIAACEKKGHAEAACTAAEREHEKKCIHCRSTIRRATLIQLCGSRR